MGEGLAEKEAEKLLSEYLKPGKGKNRKKEVLQLFRLGAKDNHQQYIVNGLKHKHFKDYDSKEKKKELAAMHVYDSGRRSPGTKFKVEDIERDAVMHAFSGAIKLAQNYQQQRPENQYELVDKKK